MTTGGADVDGKGTGGPTPVSVVGVSHVYERSDGETVAALEATDLDIAPGSFVTIVGPSGCGKSTLLRLIAGFISPTEGTITVGDSVVTGPGPDRGVVFQQANLYPWLTVAGNVEFGPKVQRRPRAERKQIVGEMLELVGLADVGGLRPYELSGGMQQRCQIARVLACHPSVLLMDEPFGALDAITRGRLQDELLSLWGETGRTIFFITHSVDEAVYLGTRVLVMSSRPGRIVADFDSPFSRRGAGPAVRDDPDFVALRAAVAAEIR